MAAALYVGSPDTCCSAFNDSGGQGCRWSGDGDWGIGNVKIAALSEISYVLFKIIFAMSLFV